MRRSEALLSLSRDHHKALSVALKMRRAEDAEEGAALFARYWEEHGRVHFRVEEETLLPTWARLGSVNQEAAARLAQEHLEIRARALMVAARPTLNDVHALGEKLTSHVRFEERELFPLIEEDLDAGDLVVVARAVSEAEASA